MRLVKMLGLAMVAAIAATAFIAAGSASAKPVHLCLKHELPCAAGNIAKTGQKIKAESTGEPTLLGTINEKCKKSSVEGKLTAESGEPLPGEITSVSFTECTPCSTVTVENLPYKASISHNGVDYDLVVKGTIKVKFSGCTFGVTCQFETKEVSLLVLNPNLPTEPHIVIHAEEEPLNRIAGSEILCGNTGKWDALYLVIEPLEGELELL